MKHKAWMVALAVMFVAGALPAADTDASGDEPLTPTQLAQRHKGLELKAREAEFLHQQRLRELQLEEREVEIERRRRSHAGRHKDGGRGAVLLLILVVNILATIWVCKDMREQKIGRALWVPIVLLAGIFGAILYAIVRLADTRNAARAPEGK